MKESVTLALCVITLFYPTQRSSACSLFCLVADGRPICGQSYDWHLDDGLVLINKRGISKQGLVDDRNPAKWASRHGSVTFNQYGREFPCGGMNEAGLVISIAMLNATRYPQPDERAAVNVPQWIQYQLDTAESVADVIASDKHVRIRPISNARVHFFIADRTGSCAAIEYLGGEMVAHHGEQLPVKVLTNSTYKMSVNWIGQFEGFGGNRPIGRALGGSRFAKAADRLRTYDGKSDAVDHVFTTLQRVAQGSFTKWSIVYDSANAKIYFRTRRAGSRRVIDYSKCDFLPTTPVMMLDVNANHEGDTVAGFVEYSPQRNRQIVNKALRGTGVLNHSHTATINRVCKYPELCRRVTVSDGE
jgi:penicillin V acylase-like amidase (Ntn superfamily)